MVRILLCIVSFSILFKINAAVGDTTEIRTHNDVLIQTNPAKGNTNYYAWGQFPKEGTYQRMYCELSMRCPDGLKCGEWDYLNYIYLGKRRGKHNDSLGWEIMRFITPYGFSFNSGWDHTWRFDITDFQSLFRDSVEIWYRHTGYEAKNDRGWIINLKFVMVEGPELRPVQNISRIMQKSIPYGNDSIFDARTEPFTWSPTAGTKYSRIKIIQTGHGMDQPSNCAEFCPRQRFLYIDSQCVDTSWVWREDCGANPVYPQAGTWIYDRANWCPGQNVEEYHYDFIASDTLNTFDLGMESYTKTSGNSNYVITAYLIEYGDYNYRRDASLIDVIQPTDHPQYGRLNPTCTEPIVKVKNTGSETIRSLDFDYGFEDGATSKGYWTGVILPGETADVRLPYTMEWKANPSLFKATITKVNHSADEEAGNNTITSPVSSKKIPQVPYRLAVYFRTNNAPTENSYHFIDAGGNVLFERKGFTQANTIYKDTFEFYIGCFTFVLADTGAPPASYPLNEDGLGWWANSNDGTGSIQLRDAGSGGIVKTFPTDFGTDYRFDFTVGYNANSSDLIYTDKIRTFPNPVKDEFAIEVPKRLVNNATQTSVRIENAQGQTIVSNTIPEFTSTIHWISLPKLPAGVYVVKVKQNNDLCTTKIVVE